MNQGTERRRRSPNGCEATVAAAYEIDKWRRELHREHAGLSTENSIHQSNRCPSENDGPEDRKSPRRSLHATDAKVATANEIDKWRREHVSIMLGSQQKIDPLNEPLSFGERWTSLINSLRRSLHDRDDGACANFSLAGFPIIGIFLASNTHDDSCCHVGFA